VDACIWVPFKRRRHTRFMDYSDSSERLALLNTSEEMGQARDTSAHVTFNVLNLTSSPQILDSHFLSFFLYSYATQWKWGRKKRIFKSAVRNKNSKLKFLIRDKVSFVGAHSQRAPPLEPWPHNPWLLVSAASLCGPYASWKMVEEGPHGRTRAWSGSCFVKAT